MKKLNFSDIQKQIIIGSILGGCSLSKQPKGKNYYLSMRSKDLLWLRYKMEELYNCFETTEVSRQNVTYICNTQSSESFTEIYNVLYKDGKRHITTKLLDNLKDIGLAIWFIEGGGWGGRGRKNAYINTTLLSEGSSELIEDYFNSMSGIRCSINCARDRKKILFSVKGTEAILRIILPKFPPFMIQRMEKGEPIH